MAVRAQQAAQLAAANAEAAARATLSRQIAADNIILSKARVGKYIQARSVYGTEETHNCSVSLPSCKDAHSHHTFGHSAHIFRLPKSLHNARMQFVLSQQSWRRQRQIHGLERTQARPNQHSPLCECEHIKDGHVALLTVRLHVKLMLPYLPCMPEHTSSSLAPCCVQVRTDHWKGMNAAQRDAVFDGQAAQLEAHRTTAVASAEAEAAAAGAQARASHARMQQVWLYVAQRGACNTLMLLQCMFFACYKTYMHTPAGNCSRGALPRAGCGSCCHAAQAGR